MGTINKTILLGRLGKDPETRATQGDNVTTFSMVTGDKYTKDGKEIDTTEWHNIVAWGRLSDSAAKLSKGSEVYIEGRKQTRKWQDRDGNDRYTVEIIASVVTFTAGSLRDQGGQGGGNQQGGGGQQSGQRRGNFAPPETTSPYLPNTNEEDVPF